MDRFTKMPTEPNLATPAPSEGRQNRCFSCKLSHKKLPAWLQPGVAEKESANSRPAGQTSITAQRRSWAKHGGSEKHRRDSRARGERRIGGGSRVRRPYNPSGGQANQGGAKWQAQILRPVRKLVLVSTPFKRDGWYPEVLAGMQMGPEAAESMTQSPLYDLYPNADWRALITKLSALLRRDYDWSKDVEALKPQTMLVYADAAKRDCAVSKALAGVEEINLEAKLVERTG